MEQFDLFDINRIPTGELINRGDNPPEGRFRQTIHIAIFNSKGELLIQQRQSTKKEWPNKWDMSVGGCVTAGERPNVSAGREAKEELGIDIDLSNVRASFTSNFIHGFDDFFIVNMDLDINKLVLQETEVQAVKWATYEEVLDLIRGGNFIEYFDGIIKLLFDMKNKHYGVLRDFD